MTDSSIAQMIRGSEGPDLRSLLASLEWVDNVYDRCGDVTYCPKCEGKKYFGHRYGCELAAALGVPTRPKLALPGN